MSQSTTHVALQGCRPAVTGRKRGAASVGPMHTLTCRPNVMTARTKQRDSELAQFAREPWILRVDRTPLLVRPSTQRDLAAIARMHARCSARTLLDRYPNGGRPPALALLERIARHEGTVVATTPRADVVAVASLAADANHGAASAELGLLVEDEWQRLGIGSELLAHVAGAAHAAGFRELIAYPAIASRRVHHMLLQVGHTRRVPDARPHLHTYLPDDAILGLGAVRQRLAS